MIGVFIEERTAMSLDDIKSEPIVINFGGKDLKLEFDNHSLALAEIQTSKGIFNIQKLMFANNLPLANCVEIFCAALAKHHDIETIIKIKEELIAKPYLLAIYSDCVVAAFMRPLIAPEIYRKILKKEAEKEGETPKKK